ncbi:hypothetical protein MKW94_011058, partial [Papaver nudicaule]|nr:hypothetical protein [Papaver nudicaule]
NSLPIQSHSFVIRSIPLTAKIQVYEELQAASCLVINEFQLQMKSRQRSRIFR